jgi:hypothetical protein
MLLSVSGPVRADEIPPNVQNYLTQHYPGWSLAPINRNAELYFKAAGWHGLPNYFSYDFDGDRGDDFALQIRHPKGTGVEEVDLVLTPHGMSLKEYVLERRPADASRRSFYFIRPILVGEKITDGRGRPVRYSDNGVEVVAYQKESFAFFFDRAAFRKIRTLDLR